MKLPEGAKCIRWADVPAEEVFAGMQRQRVDAQQMTVVRYTYGPGVDFPTHSHPEEQVVLVLSGEIDFTVSGAPVAATAGSVLVIPPGLAHSARVRGKVTVDTLNVLSPRRTKDIVFHESKQ